MHYFSAQDEFTSRNLVEKAELRNLVQGLDSGKILSLFKQCSNWPNLLKFLSLSIACRPDLKSQIYNVLEENLMQALQANDSDSFVKFLLLNRQASLEPEGKFAASYTKFFEHNFASNKEVLGCQKRLTFLFQILTELVPFEPAAILVTHLNHQLSVPQNLRDTAQGKNELR